MCFPTGPDGKMKRSLNVELPVFINYYSLLKEYVVKLFDTSNNMKHGKHTAILGRSQSHLLAQSGITSTAVMLLFFY